MKYAITTGNFDGVHTGHIFLIEQLIVKAKQLGLVPAVLTFEPHPKTFFFPDRSNPLLVNLKERVSLLKSMGVEVFVETFNQDFADLSALEFIDQIIQKKYNGHYYYLGYDHQFGKNREKIDSDQMVQNSQSPMQIERAEPFYYQSQSVSSSKIKALLESGDLHLANAMLGRAYAISGQVVRGDQIGRTIGFPTANIEVGDNNWVVPEYGVYAVKVKLESGIFDGVCNIGVRPTLSGKSLRIEAHIFDFNLDVYDQNIQIELRFHLRTEQRFSDLEALKKQILKDKIQAQYLLSL